MCFELRYNFIITSVLTISTLNSKQIHAKYLLFHSLIFSFNRIKTSEATEVLSNGSYFDIRQLCKAVNKTDKEKTITFQKCFYEIHDKNRFIKRYAILMWKQRVEIGI